MLGNSREVCEKTYVYFIEEQLKDAASKIDIIRFKQMSIYGDLRDEL